MVGGAFGVTTLGSRVLASHEGGLTYPGLFLCRVGTLHFGERGPLGLAGQRGHPVG